VDLVKFFLAKNFGASVDVCDEDGETPLFYAIRGGHGDVVKVLIQNGCNCNHRNNDGESPIDFCGDIGEENLKIFIIAQRSFSNTSENFVHEKCLAMSD